MQRKKTPAKKNKYVISGLAGKDSPGGRSPSQIQRFIQLIIIGTLALIGAVILIYLLSGIFRDQRRPRQIAAARPEYNIQPFGKDVLVYDGMILSCFDANGTNRWKYTLGMDAAYRATKTMIAAWSGHQVHVLDRNGDALFNDRMSGPVRFAQVGESLIAACVGDETDSVVTVLNHGGILQDSISFPDLYVFDIGFFSQKEKLLWVLSLDLNGNAPMTSISTHEPGRLLMGRQELNNQLVYSVYPQDNLLMLVDTSQIRAYDYKCMLQVTVPPVLVYGWQLSDVRAVGKNTYSLFQYMPQSNDSLYFSELKVVSNQNAQSLRLLSPCFASALGDKGVYCFSNSTIFFAPFGSVTFSSTVLSYQISNFICMLDGGRAVLASGNDVFILKLPE